MFNLSLFHMHANTGSYRVEKGHEIIIKQLISYEKLSFSPIIILLIIIAYYYYYKRLKIFFLSFRTNLLDKQSDLPDIILLTTLKQFYSQTEKVNLASLEPTCIADNL